MPRTSVVAGGADLQRNIMKLSACRVLVPALAVIAYVFVANVAVIAT